MAWEEEDFDYGGRGHGSYSRFEVSVSRPICERKEIALDQTSFTKEPSILEQ